MFSLPLLVIYSSRRSIPEPLIPSLSHFLPSSARIPLSHIPRPITDWASPASPISPGGRGTSRLGGGGGKRVCVGEVYLEEGLSVEVGVERKVEGEGDMVL